jgi:hypothetical protein
MAETGTRDDQEYKAGIRREWDAAAPGWQKWADIQDAEGAGQ